MTLRHTAIKDDVGTKATTNGIHPTFQVLFFVKNAHFVTSCRHGTVHLAHIVVLEFCLHSKTIRQYHICGMSFGSFQTIPHRYNHAVLESVVLQEGGYVSTLRIWNSALYAVI